MKARQWLRKAHKVAGRDWLGPRKLESGMPKIRIREMAGKPAVSRVSLGQEYLSHGHTVKGIDARGEEIEQWVPGKAICKWLQPGETADVDDELAILLCDSRQICERVAGRPKRVED